jgi:hypothetical protein
MNRIISLIAVLFLALTLVATPATVAPQQNAAEASNCRINYILCGRIQNSPWSSSSLIVTYNWGNQWSSTGLVFPGRSSPSLRDADGYYIRAGQRAWHESKYSGARISPIRYGPRWVKVRDHENPRVRITRR